MPRDKALELIELVKLGMKGKLKPITVPELKDKAFEERINPDTIIKGAQPKIPPKKEGDDL